MIGSSKPLSAENSLTPSTTRLVVGAVVAGARRRDAEDDVAVAVGVEVDRLGRRAAGGRRSVAAVSGRMPAVGAAGASSVAAATISRRRRSPACVVPRGPQHVVAPSCRRARCLMVRPATGSSPAASARHEPSADPARRRCGRPVAAVALHQPAVELRRGSPPATSSGPAGRSGSAGPRCTLVVASWSWRTNTCTPTSDSLQLVLEHRVARAPSDGRGSRSRRRSSRRRRAARGRRSTGRARCRSTASGGTRANVERHALLLGELREHRHDRAGGWR